MAQHKVNSNSFETPPQNHTKRGFLFCDLFFLFVTFGLINQLAN